MATPHTIIKTTEFFIALHRVVMYNHSYPGREPLSSQRYERDRLLAVATYGQYIYSNLTAIQCTIK